MASQFAILAILALVALPSVTVAMHWTVGDDSGWTIGYNYTNWANDKVFCVGDSLLFNYQAGNHNVFRANLTDFQECNIPSSDAGLATGHDVIRLMTPGVKRYVYGIGQHCAKLNMKLKITVVDDAESPAPPPAAPTASDKSSRTNALVL